MTSSCRNPTAAWTAAVATALLFNLALVPGPASAQEGGPDDTVRAEGSGESVRIAGASVEVTGKARSIWAAGATVTIDAAATEGVWVAGADVAVDAAVGKGIHAAGSRLDVEGVAGARAWLAGGDVRVSLTTGSDLYAAGGNVIVGPAANIGGSLSVAGGNVVIAGRVRDNARIAGGSVTVSGRIDGTVSVAAERVVLGPAAMIGGDLILLPGTDAEIAPTARIAGQTRRPGFGTWRSQDDSPFGGSRIVLALVLFGSATATGIGLMLLMWSTLTDAARRARSSPVASLILGIFVPVVIPILAVLAGLTVAGLPLALILLLSIPIFFTAGHAVAALAIADGILSRRDARHGALGSLILLLIGAAILAALVLIPYAGPILALVLVLIGCGAFAGVVWRRLRRTPASATA